MILRSELLKNALVVALVALGCAANAQVYDVGSDAQKKAKTENPAQAQDQSLGWGSNIQNARLGRAAEMALQHGDHALALGYARRAAEAAPNDPQLWFLLGYAARLNARLTESVDAYSRGLRLAPAALDGLSGLGQTYSVMGKLDDAERLLKQVVVSDSSRRDDALLLGDLYMRSANYAEAIDWLGRAERSQPGARSELLMALSYQHLNQMDLASHYLEMAKRRDPNDPEVERSMAGYYRQARNYPDAIAALQSIRMPKPDVLAELAYTYQLYGKLDDAERLYAQAADAVPKDLGLQLSAAQAEIAAGSLEKTKRFLERANGIDPAYYRLHAIRGEVANLQERGQDAVVEYTAAVANLPAEPVEGPLYGIQLHMDLMDAYKKLADEARAIQQLNEARAEINGLSDKVSGRAQFLRLRALIEMNAGDLESALSDVKEALAMKAYDRDDLQLDGDILIKLGRTEDAISNYKQILVMDPVNQSALIALGYASRVANRDAEAEKYFQRLEQAEPVFYVAYLALGDLYTARRDLTKAEGSYSEAYALAPRNALIVAGGMNAAIEAHNLDLAGVWLSRVTTEMQKEPQILREKERYLSFKEQYQASADVGREAIKVLPLDRDTVVYLGYDLLHLGKYDELLELTSKYLDIFPKEPDMPLLEGYVHKHQGLSEQARQDFTVALARDPEVVTAYLNRGFTLNDLHLPKEAAADFEAALKRDPNNGEAHLGLAYASLDLDKPQAALRETDLAKRALGDSKDLHVIRATAYGRQNMSTNAAEEYRAALKFAPHDGSLHLGLGATLFAERQYRAAITELQTAELDSPNNASVEALLARSYAELQDRSEALRYVGLAEQNAAQALISPKDPESGLGDVYVATGEAFNTLGDHDDAMKRFSEALAQPGSNRAGVRVAIAQLLADEDRPEAAERQLALAQMEGQSGSAKPPTGTQLIAAADVLRSMHDYELSQTYLQRAKAAGSPDVEVRIGLANNYLALGDTARAQAELSAVRATEGAATNYQYLLAEANVNRQQHHGAQALTSFAKASNAGGDDQAAEQDLLEAGADEGLRVTPVLSVLSDLLIEPVFEDSTVYVLDSKLDASFPVPPSASALLPPPRSSIQTQSTSVFHLHFNHLPTTSGFFQVRNAQGQISVPSTNSVINRNTTDYTLNVGLDPTLKLGNNVLTFNSGIQGTVRRDSESPVAMNQNLVRVFTYMSTSSFFNAVSVSGYAMRESGPFTESNLHSVTTTAAVDFRVGTPWGKTALVTGWGATDQQFSPVNYKAYYTSSYIGAECKFRRRLDIKAVAEDIRAWRVVGINSGIAQNLRPAGIVDFAPNHSWDMQLSSSYSNTRSFHVYDAIQNGFSMSYARPIRRKFNDDSGTIILAYPIRFSAGIQQETFFNFTGGRNQQFRPYVRISVF